MMGAVENWFAAFLFFICFVLRNPQIETQGSQQTLLSYFLKKAPNHLEVNLPPYTVCVFVGNYTSSSNQLRQQKCAHIPTFDFFGGSC
jgi:hypothetical protein